MKRALIIILSSIMILSTGCIGAGGVEGIKNNNSNIQLNEQNDSNGEAGEEEELIEGDTIEALNNAEEIEIKESIITLGKKYKIYADGKRVGTVEGKVIKAFGEVFSFYDNDDNLLYYEEQEKRWGLKFNRAAVIKDHEDEVVGYIGEESDSKIFSIGRYLHLYDEDKNEIGVLDQKNFTLNKQIDIYDKDKNSEDAVKLYEVEKEFISIGDKYEIKVYDTSVIPIYQMIFAVCIDDAISDSEKAKAKSKK